MPYIRYTVLQLVDRQRVVRTHLVGKSGVWGVGLAIEVVVG